MYLMSEKKKKKHISKEKEEKGLKCQKEIKKTHVLFYITYFNIRLLMNYLLKFKKLHIN